MLAGDVGVLGEAREAFAFSSEASAAVAELAETVDALVGSGLGPRLAIDLGEVRALYYTGLVFRAYARGLGFEVGSGGRYDSLLARFGRPLPAVGFMLGLDRLALLLERQGMPEASPRRRRRDRGRGASLAEALIQARALARRKAAGFGCKGPDDPHGRPLEGQAARRHGSAVPWRGPAVPGGRGAPARGADGRLALPVREGHGRAHVRRVRRGRLRHRRARRAAGAGERRVRAARPRVRPLPAGGRATARRPGLRIARPPCASRPSTRAWPRRTSWLAASRSRW